MKKSKKPYQKYLWAIIIVSVLVLGGLIYYSFIQASFTGDIVASFRMNETDGTMLDEHNNVSYGSGSAIQDGEAFLVYNNHYAQANNLIPKSSTGGIGFMIKAGATSSLRMPFVIGQDNSNYIRFLIGYYDDTLSITDYMGGYGGAFNTGVVLPDSQEWINVLILSNGTSYTSYVDGVMMATGGNGEWTANSPIELNHIRFGTSFNNGDGTGGIYLKNVVLFDDVLTEQEVADYYEAYNISTGYPFTKYYSVDVGEVIGGSVTGNGTYAESDEVVIEAIPDSGYEFVSWNTPFENESSSFTLIVNEDTEVTPTFQLIPSSSSGGSSSTSLSDGTDYRSINNEYNLTISESNYSMVELKWYQRFWNWVVNIFNTIILWTRNLG